MSAAPRAWARDLLYTWFHRLGSSDWFGGSERVDALLERRFAHWVAPLGTRPAPEFLSDRRTALAGVLLFDQIPRNTHRDSPLAFAWDPLARAITVEAIRRNWHLDFSRSEKQFLFMPLMHSEEIADHLLSLELFARHVPGALSFARSHYRMIARFGRYPHRNEVLSRKSTDAEKRALAAGNSW